MEDRNHRATEALFTMESFVYHVAIADKTQCKPIIIEEQDNNSAATAPRSSG